MDEIGKLLEKIKNIISNYDSNDDEYIKLKEIEELLNKPKSFLEVPINDAFNMLEELDVENIRETYKNIIKSYFE